MAELTNPADADATSSCCSPREQASCCEAVEKASCCDTAAAGGSCGCSAGETLEAPIALGDLRETVREKYAAATRAASAPEGSRCGCGPVSTTDEQGTQVFGSALYAGQEPAPGTEASLGCGVPTAVADLHEGETVLDLGSGAGGDVLISARRVGPAGKAIGLDMTDEMLDLARANAAQAGLGNVEFVRGEIEDIPLPDGSVDVVISNCVINLSGDKDQVLREAARVLRPGGRFAVSDVIADEGMDDATRADIQQWTGCIAGALTRRQFEASLAQAASSSSRSPRPTGCTPRRRSGTDAYGTARAMAMAMASPGLEPGTPRFSVVCSTN